MSQHIGNNKVKSSLLRVPCFIFCQQIFSMNIAMTGVAIDESSAPLPALNEVSVSGNDLPWHV